MQCALLTQISQPVLTILSLSAIPSASCLSEEKTNSSSTGHCPQHSRRRLIRRLVLPATQPRNRNHLLHRLTGDPVSSRSSRIRSNDLSQLVISLHAHTHAHPLSPRVNQKQLTIPPWNRKASVVVPCASLIGQSGFVWSSVIARRNPAGYFCQYLPFFQPWPWILDLDFG